MKKFNETMKRFGLNLVEKIDKPTNEENAESMVKRLEKKYDVKIQQTEKRLDNLQKTADVMSNEISYLRKN